MRGLKAENENKMLLHTKKNGCFEKDEMSLMTAHMTVRRCLAYSSYSCTF